MYMYIIYTLVAKRKTQHMIITRLKQITIPILLKVLTHDEPFNLIIFYSIPLRVPYLIPVNT